MKIILSAGLFFISSLLMAQAQQISEFSGTISFNGCSASLIKLKGMNLRRALILTNGHCLGKLIDPDKVILNTKFEKRAGLFNKKGVMYTSLYTTRIVYATMTKTDLAILEVGKSYEEIKSKYDIEPLVLADTAPRAGEPITVVSGYWKETFKCFIKDIVYKVQEADWYWLDSLGYTDECHVKGGSSGSPIISDQTGEVIGVNNSVNESGDENEGAKICTMNNPCEVSEDGTVSVYKGKGYGQNTHWPYNCLDASKITEVKFDFSRTDCRLPAPR